MKILFFSALTIIALLFYSCQKQETSNNGGGNTVYLTPTMSATVNGAPIVFIATLNDTWFANEEVVLDGVCKDFEIKIWLPVPTDTVTLKLNSGNIASAEIDSSNYVYNIPVTGNFGTVTITSFNPNNGAFSGIFNFSVDHSVGKRKVVANGVFSNF